MTFVDQNRLKGNHAQAFVAAWLSRTCLVRPVADGTDVGVDLYCESILDGQPFLHFWAQIKSIPLSNVRTESGKQIASHRFDRKHLIYWDRQPIPVYAFLVPLDDWPSAEPDRVYGIRITEQLVRGGVPDSATALFETSECFEADSLNDDLQQFVTRIVPWDTAAMLLKRGIVAPLLEPSSGGDLAFPTLVGIQYLPRILTTMRDASVHGLFHSLLGERANGALVPIRRRFQALAEFFENEMHDWGLSMLVRAAHTEGDIERAKGYVTRAIARISLDESIPAPARAARVQKIRVLLDDFESEAG